MKRNAMIVVFLFLTSILTAQAGLDLPQGKWWTKAEVRENIKLSDDQVRRLDSIFLNHMERLIDLKAEMEKAELNLKELLDAPVLEEKEALTLLDRLIKARGQLERTRAEMLIRMRLELTPDQWARVKRFVDGRRGQFQDGRERMRDRFPDRHPGPPNDPPPNGPGRPQ